MIKRTSQFYLVLAITVSGCGVFGGEKWKARCKEPVEIYSGSECEMKPERVVPAGTILRVIDEGYGKDCKYQKVKLPDGTIGYIYFPFKVEIIEAK